MYLVFTRMPSESYRSRLKSLLLCLCDIFRALINSFMCCLSTAEGTSSRLRFEWKISPHWVLGTVKKTMIRSKKKIYIYIYRRYKLSASLAPFPRAVSRVINTETIDFFSSPPAVTVRTCVTVMVDCALHIKYLSVSPSLSLRRLVHSKDNWRKFSCTREISHKFV